MIFDVIATRWKAVLASGALSGRSAAEKLAIFRETEVTYPVMMGAHCRGGDVIPVDFRGKRKVSLSDRCACGSGLPFMSCCGRTYGVEELRPGAF
jgi:hypothetical protein